MDGMRHPIIALNKHSVGDFVNALHLPDARVTLSYNPNLVSWNHIPPFDPVLRRSWFGNGVERSGIKMRFVHWP